MLPAMRVHRQHTVHGHRGFRTVTTVRSVLLGAAVVLLTGCQTLGDYRGDYAGLVVGTDGDSFIRRGFPAGTRLTVRGFHPPGDGPVSGTLTTAPDPILNDAVLKTIAPLEHDQLSQYDFPGDNRLRNFMFAVTAQSAAGPREAMAFVSLLENGNLEVRVVSGSGDDEGDLFGLFVLDRK